MTNKDLFEIRAYEYHASNEQEVYIAERARQWLMSIPLLAVWLSSVVTLKNSLLYSFSVASSSLQTMASF
jgi:hypothetical protein